MNYYPTLCITSVFGVELRRVLNDFQCFGKHCNCYLQGEAIINTLDSGR